MHKSVTYYLNKARIDKALHEKTAYKIQLYNNQLVDKYVEKYNDAGESSKPVSAVIYAELSILNKPEVYKNYNKIINSKYTSNDAIFKMLVKNQANKDLEHIVEAETERISKNLDYVDKVLKEYDVPTQEYKRLLAEQEKNSIANRKQILTDVAVKANDLLVSEGLNIPSNMFSYYNLETMATSLLRQSQMKADYNKVTSINEQSVSEGKHPIYTHKTWVHTHKGKTTRHTSNHGQKVLIDEPFIVVNDKTLHIDEMMYPSDPAGSFQNAFICYCEVDYTNENNTVSTFWNKEPITYSHNTNYTTEPVQPKPSVKFGNELSVDLNKPTNVKKVTIQKPVDLQGNFKTNKVVTGTPVASHIDVDVDGISSIPHNYLIDGNKLEIVYNDGKYYYNGLELKDYDYSTAIGKMSKASVTKHNNNLPTVEDNKPVKSFIDTDVVAEEGLYHEHGDKYSFFDFMDEVDEIDGKYYYHGLDITPYWNYEKGWGDVPASVIEEHNKQFNNAPKTTIGETVGNLTDTEINNNLPNEQPKAKGKYIEINEYTNTSTDILIVADDGITKLDNGDFEFNGIVIPKGNNALNELYYNPDKDIGKISMSIIEEHNKQFQDNDDAVVPTSNKKIDTISLYYDEYVKEYTVFGNDIESINGKKYYQGLDITPYYNYEKDWADIPKQVIDDYNAGKIDSLISNDISSKEPKNVITPPPIENEEVIDYEFKPIKKFKDKIHNKISSVIQYGKDIDDQAYAVHKETGRQYVLDENSKYERRQDELQNKVDMSDQYNAVEDWGGGGYRPINHFNYNKSSCEGQIYKELRDEIHPILDKMRIELSKGNSVEHLKEDINNIKNKYINNGYLNERDRVWKTITELQDIDEAMVKAPPLQQDTCFIRAGAWNLDFNKIGEIFEWEGYAGTSYKNRPVDLGHESLSYNITILAPKGTKGVRLSKQFDALTNEREWLLPRGQKFRVLEFDEEECTCTIELIIDEEWS